MGDALPVRIAPYTESCTYQVYICPYSGWWRRWRGRIITRDGEGVQDIWAWQAARSRQRLLESLWAEVVNDIAGRRGGAAVEIAEVQFKPG
jgi:hypothetical protein